MRIRSIRITSFGKYRDWSMTEIPEGLTLITGDNESGKTTMMEFMRSTMFPTSRRSYPVPSKTDAGSMEIETESGEKMTLMREQRKVTEISGKKLPEEMFSMDSDTYRSIFAMDLADLTDANAISSERIRNRFLTIPGGEKVPQVIKDVSSSKTALMNEERITERNPIGSIQMSLMQLDRKIADARERDSEYDAYAEERRSAVSELSRLEKMQVIVDRERERRNVIMAQGPNLQRLRSMESRRSELEYARDLSEDTQNRYAVIIHRMSVLNDAIEDHGDIELMDGDFWNDLRVLQSDLRAFIREYDQMTDRLEQLKDSIAEDEEYIEESRISPELSVPEKRKEIMERSKKNRVPYVSLILLIAGLGLAAASLYFEKMLLVAGAALAVVGTYGIIRAKLDRKFEKWMESQGYPPLKRGRIPSFLMKLEMVFEASRRITNSTKDIEHISQTIDSMASRAKDALDYLGMETVSPDPMGSALEIISKEVEAEEERIRRSDKLEEMKLETETLSDERNSIVSVYGGEEGFRKACGDRSELIGLDRDIRWAAESIMSATGLTPDEMDLALNEDADDTIDMKEEISELNRRLGELGERMDRTLRDGDLGRLQTERNAKWAELVEKVREWGVLSLEESMIDLSCTDLYSKMQPSVIETANRYLAMMTNGRYSLDPDPRLEEIVIKDSLQHKTSRQWSSGLGDQVYLSIKMAVAKEMGSERLPMILDDILVRFDQDRRRGACAAILDFAKDQQVFLFSCDSTVENAFPSGTVLNKVRL